MEMESQEKVFVIAEERESSLLLGKNGEKV